MVFIFNFSKKILILLFSFFIVYLFLIPSVSADNNVSKVYMLGDSRFVGMQKYDSDINHIYFAKVGEGYNFLKTVWEKNKNLPTENDYIVINFGVNDLGNLTKYIEYINKISNETKTKVIFMTVNPVDEYTESKNGYKVKNETITNFNLQLAENTNDNVYIIDTNSLLNKYGFSTSDGLHFDKKTYSRILEYLDCYLDNFNE